MVVNRDKHRRSAAAKAKSGEPQAKKGESKDAPADGGSRATRTVRLSISTTPEVQAMVTEAAHERWVSRSQLVEDAIVAYLRGNK